MFTKIIEWIRKWVNSMIGKTSLKQAIGTDIAISQPMITALELWSRMYENKAEWIKDDIVSLNLPAAIASEISRAATIELKITIEGSKRADYLALQFEKVVDSLRTQVEFGAAKGGLAIKPYVDGKNLNVDFVQADQFFPVKFDANGNITSCVFVDQRTVGDKYFTRLEYHDITDAGYVVKNMAYKSTAKDMLGQEIGLDVIEDWNGLEPVATIENVDKPLFAYFRYPLANNIDSTSPLGVSCYSRAVGSIEQADRTFSNLLWEFDSGQRALYVDVLAYGKDANGKPKLPNKRLYRTLETGSAEGELFKEWSPTLREQNILNGLEAILKKVEFQCGLAYGTLSDPNTIDKTATEIISTKQRSAATVVDCQKALQSTLDQLLYAMDTWATLNKLAPKGKYSVTYDFDDSVVIDKESQMMQDRQTVSMQAMPKWMFLVRNYGMDEASAKKQIAEVTAETPPVDLFGGV